MANIHYSAYGGTCVACTEAGRVWLSPAGDPIRLCADHEALVSGEPDWVAADDLSPR